MVRLWDSLRTQANGQEVRSEWVKLSLEWTVLDNKRPEKVGSEPWRLRRRAEGQGGPHRKWGLASRRWSYKDWGPGQNIGSWRSGSASGTDPAWLPWGQEARDKECPPAWGYGASSQAGHGGKLPRRKRTWCSEGWPEGYSHPWITESWA